MLKKLSVTLLIAVSIIGCSKNKDGLTSKNYTEIDVVDPNKISLNDTTKIAFDECLNNSENHFRICFDSVITDSRCPAGVECFWEGYALVSFTFVQPNKNTHFDLSTHAIFPTDTTIDGYRISLIGLNPYPIFGNQINQKDYVAQILIKKK